MTFLQNLWRDLVDKHLWPVALLLVAAAVAVPFLVGKGSSEPVSSTAAPGTAAAPLPGQVAVAVADGEQPVERSGDARDPFKPLVFDKAAKAVAAATAATAAGTSSATRATSTSASSSAPSSAGATKGSSSASTTPSTTTTPDTTPPPATTTPAAGKTTTKTKLYTYGIDVLIKRGGRTTTRNNVQAVSYLPSPAYPIAAFIGVKNDGKTAIFLLSGGVKVLSEKAACVPTRAACTVVELGAGENVLLSTVPRLGEPMKRYRLMVRAVALEPAKTEAQKGKSTRANRSADDVDLAKALRLAPLRTITSTPSGR